MFSTAILVMWFHSKCTVLGIGELATVVYYVMSNIVIYKLITA